MNVLGLVLVSLLHAIEHCFQMGRSQDLSVLELKLNKMKVQQIALEIWICVYSEYLIVPEYCIPKPGTSGTLGMAY